MRIAPSVAVVLATTLVLTTTAPRPAQGVNPVAVAKGAITVLAPFVRGYLANLREKREAEMIRVRVWMHNEADTRLNGCGLYFRAEGHAGGVAEGHFPRKANHLCNNDTRFDPPRYEMRMTSQSAMYDTKLRLAGNQQVKTVELHADGWHNTYVRVICFGFNERTIAGGPRAFCVNRQLLKACQDLTNRWRDVAMRYTTIMFTRTSRGMHKIIFRDIETLINGFDRLDADLENADASAVRRVCDRIELVRGTDAADRWKCPARKSWTQGTGAGNFFSWSTKYADEDKNPYGCKRYTHRKR